MIEPHINSPHHIIVVCEWINIVTLSLTMYKLTIKNHIWSWHTIWGFDISVHCRMASYLTCNKAFFSLKLLCAMLKKSGPIFSKSFPPLWQPQCGGSPRQSMFLMVCPSWAGSLSRLPVYIHIVLANGLVDSIRKLGIIWLNCRLNQRPVHEVSVNEDKFQSVQYKNTILPICVVLFQVLMVKKGAMDSLFRGNDKKYGIA
jgi:hypothetical protein